jgi:methylisocitrate lyase
MPKRFRLLLEARQLLVSGCFDALSARLAEHVGFAAVYVSGFAVEASQLASPDIGLITRTEMCTHAGRIAASVDLPVICDVDTGYGDTLNVRRTVHEFERAGIAAIQLEDQVEPKRCPLLEERAVLPPAAAEQRVRAAVEARTDPDFMIIGRTDADVISFEEAVSRCRLYLAAGAGAVMSPLKQVDGVPMSSLSPDAQLDAHRRFCQEVGGSAIATSVVPTHTAADMLSAGYSAVVMPTLAFQAAATAMMTALREAVTNGTAEEYFRAVPRDPEVVGLGLLKLLGVEAALETQRRFRTATPD